LTIRADYTEKEWHLLVFAPIFAVTYVGLIDGKIDRQETLAMNEALKRKEEAYTSCHLVSAAVDDLPSLTREMLIPGELRYVETRGEALRIFQKIARLVDKKASTEEAEIYKQFLVDIVCRVARSSGKLLGLIGDDVCEEEAEFIRMMKVAIGVVSR